MGGHDSVHGCRIAHLCLNFGNYVSSIVPRNNMYIPMVAKAAPNECPVRRMVPCSVPVIRRAKLFQ